MKMQKTKYCWNKNSYFNISSWLIFYQLPRYVFAFYGSFRHFRFALPRSVGTMGVEGCWRRVSNPRRCYES